MTVGVEDYRYRLVPDWGDQAIRAQIGIVTAVATDANDRVYVADREPNDVIRVFERDGTYVETWGQDFLKRPHSIWIGPDQLAYITDIIHHTVEICRLDGTVVQTIGTRGTPGEPGAPFNGRPGRCGRRGATCTSPTATARSACTGLRRRGSWCAPGEPRAPVPASSSSRTA